MKIDKRNCRHWLYLGLFGLNVLTAMLLRPFWPRPGKRRVILYGHKLNGNLLAIQRHVGMTGDIDTTFLTMDSAYCRELAERGEPCRLAIDPRCIAVLASAEAVISDHGLHALQAMLWFSNLRFFDVWHGIPFKGFDADDFRTQHRYDETWVPSPLLGRLYVERFGFAPDKVAVTGYARTDRLVQQDAGSIEMARRALGLSEDNGRIILFAPTWKQDADNRSLFPFGTDEASFCRALSDLACRMQSTVLLRTHLNSVDGAATDFERVVRLPSALYPHTEEILLASDILVCDWSSIAFDFLLLERPTIFLDVEAPFAKGLSLDERYRFGAMASSMNELLQLLERYLIEPANYMQAYSAKSAEVRQTVYGDFADGRSAERCVARLRQQIATGGSSR